METVQRMNGGIASTPIVLRPMGLGEILDLAFRLYRKNFITLIGIAAIVNLPLLFLQAIAAFLALPADFSALSRTPGNFNSYSGLLIFYGAYVIISLITVIANVFEAGAMAAAVSARYLGRDITIKQAYGQSLRKWFRLLVASILVGLISLIFVAPIILFVAVSVFGSFIGDQAASAFAAIASLCMCLGMIVLLPVWIYLMIRFSFYSQAIVLENLGTRTGLARSWRLVKNSFLRVLGIVVLLAILVYILTVVPALLIQFAVTALAPTSFALTTIASSASNIIISILISPIQLAVMTLLYYDLRIRKEGFDLQFQMQQSDSTLPLVALTGNL